ncbi:Histone-lysine N-methyltransferase SETMAR [Eumeta japonica]|uniref:Histone-lysine N-methyltransferase SETMAR n=1 Tax=Eumeta variegata TaxID=151549 RepID=A0A4C1W036_EUMVA|nr:Histone-lysine N-methyltransferase SETMAR [Eumeta japonica]
MLFKKDLNSASMGVGINSRTELKITSVEQTPWTTGTLVNNEELKLIVQAHSSQTTSDYSRSGQMITADYYCQQLQTVMEKLAIQQHSLVNCSSPLLFQDNAKPRTSRKTVNKLEEL